MNFTDGKYARLLLVVLIFVTGAFLRTHRIGNQSVWYDESVSVQIAASSLHDIVSGRVKDLGNPPLYWITLHFWSGLFGTGEVSIRLMSALFGIITLYLVYRLGLLLFSGQIARLALFLLAISPFHIYYAQEARTYSLLTLLCTLSYLFMVKYLRSEKTRYLCLYTFAAFLSLYSHYFAGFVILAQNLFLLFFREKYKKLLLRWAVSQVAIAAGFSLLWLPSLAGQLTAEGNLGRSAESWYRHLIATPFICSVGKTLVWKSSPFSHVVAYMALFAVTFLPAFVLGIAKLRKNREAFALFGLWLFVPILVPLIISVLLFPLYNSTYIIMSSIPYYFVLGLGILNLPAARLRGLLVAAMAGMCIVSVMNYYHTDVKFDWRGAAGHFRDKQAGNDGILLFDADFNETAFSHYYQGDLEKIRLLDAPPAGSNRIFGWKNGEEDKGEFTGYLKEKKRIWLVLSDNLTHGAGDYYEKRLNELFQREQTVDFKGIRLCLYLNAGER